MKTFQEYINEILKGVTFPDLTFDQLKDVLKKLRIKWDYASELDFRKTPYGYQDGYYEIKIPNGVIFQYRPAGREGFANGMGTVIVGGAQKDFFRDIAGFTKLVKKYSKIKKK